MNETNQIILDSLKDELSRKFGIADAVELKVLADDLKDAMTDVLDYCNQDILTGNMATSVKDLYVIRKNSEGNEGESSRSEGGVTQSFEIGIPAKIKTKLNRYRVAKVRSL